MEIKFRYCGRSYVPKVAVIIPPIPHVLQPCYLASPSSRGRVDFSTRTWVGSVTALTNRIQQTGHCCFWAQPLFWQFQLLPLGKSTLGMLSLRSQHWAVSRPNHTEEPCIGASIILQPNSQPTACIRCQPPERAIQGILLRQDLK